MRVIFLPRDRYALRYDDGTEQRLFPSHGVLLLALMSRYRLTAAVASEICWPDPDRMPDGWNGVLQTNICNLRRHLERGGWTITSRYGQGWALNRWDDEEAAAYRRTYRIIYEKKRSGGYDNQQNR